MELDPYKTLQLPSTASLNEIKKRYRTLSLNHHPDRPGGDASKFNLVKEAYEAILSTNDTAARRPKEHDGQTIPHMHGAVYMDTDVGMPPDIIAAMLGMPSFHHSSLPVYSDYGPPHTMPTTDIHDVEATIDVSYEQAYTGYSLPLLVSREDLRSTPSKTTKETMYVDIPEGIDDREVIVLKGRGNIYHRDVVSDVRVTVRITSDDSCCTRKGLDVWYTVDVTLKEALCGFVGEVVHFAGSKIKVNSPPGTVIDPNSPRRLRGYGFTREGRKGDLLVVFKVAMPKSLSEEQISRLQDIL